MAKSGLIKKKKCSICDKTKWVSYFWKDSKSKDGLSRKCILCAKKQIKNWRMNNKEAYRLFQREARLRRRFGLLPEEYEVMLMKQKGVCAICKQKETSTDKFGNVKMLAVDHNHVTGKIRGLLCQRCNIGIGKLKIDECGTKLLTSALKYIGETDG